MRTRSISILIVILLLHFTLANAYCDVGEDGNITISGIVKDQSGEPLIGASVFLIAGASKSGSVSDFNGNFRVSVAPQEQRSFQIKASYVGYKTASGSFSVSSLKNGQGTVTINMIDDVRKNKKKSSRIIAKNFNSLADDLLLYMTNPIASNQLTPEQLYNEANNYYYGENGVKKDYNKAFELYLQAAEQGHSDSQLEVGYMYETGKGINQDKEKAVYWYQKSANQDNKIAQCNLGYCYEKSIGVEKNLESAVYWYQKAAAQGHARAQSNLAELYFFGNGVEKDYAQCYYWTKKAAEQGNSNGQFRLAYLYYHELGTNKDYQLAMQWYLKAANQDHKGAMNNIGVMYENGDGVTADKSIALAWYNKAAAKGNEKSKENAAKLVAQGIKPATLTTSQTTNVATNQTASKPTTQTTPKTTTLSAANTTAGVLSTAQTTKSQDTSSNYQKALEYYIGQNGVGINDHIAFHYMKQAAENDNEQGAYCLLGQMYENGYGVDKNYNEALACYEKGMEGNDSTWLNWSLVNIAMMHYNGHGLKKDTPKAKQILQPLAQKGNMLAEYYLAYILFDEKDYKKAIHWYDKSAKQGYGSAYNDLGYMYLEGEGVKKDYEKALNYYMKALELGSIGSKVGLGRMYENGWGVKQDIPKAVTLIREAADYGNRAGQYHIGRLYENGIGLKKDMLEAISWYRKSADKDFEKAQKRLQELEKQITQSGSAVVGQQAIAYKPVVQQSVSQQKGKRYALIIGNSDYTDGPLTNPVNDAKDMRAKLSELGFEVMGTTNIKSKGVMRDMVRDFCAKAKNYDAVLFFYSGHARQDNGVNYLIPTRTDIKSEGDIEDQCMSMNWVVKEMQGTGSKNVIVLLDACRNAPPIPQLTRDGGVKGLANMPAKKGSFVGFATQSGDVALDGRGQRNSPYTAALLKMLNEPGLPHYTLFRRVKQMVLDATNQKQMPAEDDKLPEDFIFNQK